MQILMSLVVLADLSGTWALDREASEPMETLLTETQELSWIERQLVSSVDVEHVISQDGEAVDVDVVTAIYTRNAKLTTDGEWRDATLRTGPAQQRSYWEGEVLVVVSKGTIADGTDAVYTTRRWVDGDDMFFELHIAASDGREWTSKRVLRRS
jgi:hypothetical protein